MNNNLIEFQRDPAAPETLPQKTTYRAGSP